MEVRYLGRLVVRQRFHHVVSRPDPRRLAAPIFSKIDSVETLEHEGATLDVLLLSQLADE